MVALLQSFHKAVQSLPFPSFANRLISGRLPLKSPQGTSLRSLPNEMLLEIFSHLELKPYILCHGVCKEWRQLLPLTKMDPIREQLLDLYHRILSTPNFEEALTWTDKNLQPFDREEYIRRLLAQYPAVPEEFRMWILEWPARLVVQSIWPALPFGHSVAGCSCPRRNGINWIAYRSFSPQLSAMEIYRHDRPTQIFIPALYIWYDATSYDWLIFEQDEDEVDLFGRVLEFHQQDDPIGTICAYLTDHDSDSNTVDSIDKAAVFDDWISYLHSRWHFVCRDILKPPYKKVYKEFSVDQPVPYFFATPASGILPAPAWDPCQYAISR